VTKMNHVRIQLFDNKDVHNLSTFVRQNDDSCKESARGIV
jgi:hypothetical protein